MKLSLKNQRSAAFCYRLLFVLIVSLWLVITVVRRPDDGLGTDFYPFYRTGEALRAGESPYSEAVLQDMIRVWNVAFPATGFAYPLPAAVGVWPILLLPLPLAIAVWTTIGTAGTFAAIGLHQNWRTLLLLPFVFMPVYHAIVMHQATLVWFAFIVLLIVAMRQRWSWVAGWCIVLLPGKPQVGLLFTLAGLWWAWREDRRTLPWVAGWSLLVWGASFAVQPTWVQDWLHSLSRYNGVGHTVSMLPWSLVLLTVTWRLPWYAQLGAAQVVLFPAVDVYTALPLLLAWIHIGGPLALIGSGLSWLWLFAGMPQTITTFWLVIMLPLIVCAAWRVCQELWLRRLSSAQP